MVEQNAETSFAGRAEFINMVLKSIGCGLPTLPTRSPWTLHCDDVRLAYSCGDAGNLLVFMVEYRLRATNRDGTDVWKFHCEFAMLYQFTGAPPTPEDIDDMRNSVLRLAHNNLREIAHGMTQLCGFVSPLVIDVAQFPVPAAAE